jgi:hypothetical protein
MPIKQILGWLSGVPRLDTEIFALPPTEEFLLQKFDSSFQLSHLFGGCIKRKRSRDFDRYTEQLQLPFNTGGCTYAAIPKQVQRDRICT